MVLTLLTTDVTASRLEHLSHSLLHLEDALGRRLRQFFAPDEGTEANDLPTLPPTTGEDPYSRFVREQNLDDDSQLLLLLALAPWVKPEFFDGIIRSVLPEAGDYPSSAACADASTVASCPPATRPFSYWRARISSGGSTGKRGSWAITHWWTRGSSASSKPSTANLR